MMLDDLRKNSFARRVLDVYSWRLELLVKLGTRNDIHLEQATGSHHIFPSLLL
jgi:hypothetical protein